MPKTYFTSDLHFNHAAIIAYCCRPFANIEEMNAGLLDMWNSTVKDGDTVFFLGDFAMKHSVLLEYLPQLKGRITMVSGNHDKFMEFKGKEAKAKRVADEVLAACPNVVEIVQEKKIVLHGYKVLLSHFPWREDEDNHSAEHNAYKDRYTEYKPSRRDNPGHLLAFGHKHSPPSQRLGIRSVEISYDSWGKMVSSEELIEEFKKTV